MKIEKALSRRLSVTLWLSSLLVVAVSPLPTLRTRAQENAAQSPQAQTPAKKGKPILFEVLQGYYANKFPDQKKAGVIMLDPQRGAGMFIVYPGKGQSTAELVGEIKPMVAGMFLEAPKGKAKAEAAWAASPLPKHEGIDNESGTMFLASDKSNEVQLAVYIRTYDETEIAYGYFAMRGKRKKSKEDGRLLDSSGGGVEDFDKFWRSIRKEEK